MIRKSNGYAALILLVLSALLLISYFYIVPVFAKLFTTFTVDDNYVQYTTELECKGKGAWYDGSCHQLPSRAMETMEKIRSRWLFAPVVFIVSLIFWFIVSALRKDPQQYMR